MSTATKAPTQPPKPHVESLIKKRAEEFDRALLEDETFFHCCVEYCLALLNKLAVPRHRLREIVLPGSAALSYKHIPTADQEEQLLQRFADVVRERQPRLYALYDENIRSQLRRLCCEWLRQHAGYEESQALLDNAVKEIKHQLSGPWDNPVRFVTDPVTGARRLDAPYPDTTPAHFLEAQAFLKELDPARPVRKPGRPKGIQKPTGSGRAPLPSKESLAVFQAMEGDGKDWKYCVRQILNKKLPSDHKERERLRAYVGRLKDNGGILSKKSVR